MNWTSFGVIIGALPLSLSAQTFTAWDPASGGNGHFYAVTPAAMNWTQAEAFAVSMGGHLASVTSAAEQGFIEATFLTGGLAQSPLWIGLTDQTAEGTWLWTTGEPFGYTQWHSGEPDNSAGDEDYIALNWHRAAAAGNLRGTWNDTPLAGTTTHEGNTDGPYFGLVEIALASSAGALFTNGSFENTAGTFVNNGQSYMNVGPGGVAIPGWTVATRGISWIVSPNAFGLTAAQGTYFLDLTGVADNNTFGGVTRTIPTAPGHTYAVSFSIGSGGTTGPYGGTKSILATAGPVSQTFTFTPAGPGGQWGSFSMPFIANSFATRISLRGSASGSGSNYLGLDNVSVVLTSFSSGAVFEPASIPGSWFFSWPATSGVSYQAQSSTDLFAWINEGPAGPASGTYMARLVTPGPGTPRLFFRARPIP